MSELVPVNGTHLFCDVLGAGEPTFLLHNGGGHPLETWDPVAERIARRSRVIRFDPRGWSRSQPPAAPYTLDTLAQDVVGLLDHFAVQSAVVVGHAWGGRIAQVVARDFPERVRALVLCGTGGQFPLGPHWAFPMLQQADLERTAWERAFLAAYCGERFPREQPERVRLLLDTGWEERRQRPRPSYQAEATRRTPSATYWATASMPTLLIYGSEDHNGTREHAEDLARRLRDTRLVYVEGAGHYAIWEQPEAVGDAIQQFMLDRGIWQSPMTRS